MPDLVARRDDAGGAALVSGGRVLGFHADLVDGVFGEIDGGDDGGGVVFRNAERAAVDHVIDRALDGAVDGVGGDVDAGTAGGDVLNGEGAGGVVGAVGGSDAGAELNEVVDVAGEQGDAVDGFSGDQLADGGVAGIDERGGFSDGDDLTDLADLEDEVDGGDLVNGDADILLDHGAKALGGGADLVGSGRQRDKVVEAGAGGDGGELGAGSRVRGGDGGPGNDGTGGVGDETADAAAAGLGGGQCGGGEESRGEGGLPKKEDG